MSQYLRRSVLFLCVFYLCLVIFPGKQQNRTYSNQDKGTADRTGKENVQTPVRQHQCPAEVFLSQRPQHNAEQTGISYIRLLVEYAPAMQKVNTIAAKIS